MTWQDLCLYGPGWAVARPPVQAPLPSPLGRALQPEGRSMSDIADFLRARYVERRAIAEAASPGPWRPNEEGDEVLAVDGIAVAEGFALSGRQLRATVDHIVANDPTNVLADLDAKLGIVEWHAAQRDDVTPWGKPVQICYCGYDLPCRTLRYLAKPFHGHPDHKGEEWAP